MFKVFYSAAAGTTYNRNRELKLRLRIFVIDDEECIRDTFKWHLEELGHEVVTAAEPMLCDVYCGQDCQEDYPCGDLILCDYHMPKMNGLDFIEQMDRRGCNLPAKNKYIISGNTTAVDLKKAAVLGCHILEKPVSLERLEQITLEVKGNLDPRRKLADLANKMK